MTPKPRSKRIEEHNGPFNKEIAARMRELGMTRLEEFAEYSGIGPTTVYNLVLGRVSSHGGFTKPSVDTLVKLSKALNIPLHHLVYRLEPNALGADDPDTLPLQRVEVGVAGWVGAGPEQFEWSEKKIWVEADFARGKDLIAFKIRGDSMAAGRRPIYDGDLVIVNRKDKGFNNAPVVARLSSGAYVCKLLKDDKFSNIVMLASANPEHLNGTPTTVPPEDVAEIVGRVVRIIHDEP